MVNFGRRRGLSSAYALPLLAEAVLMLCFGLMGAWLAALPGLFVPATVMLLCLMMGLQNAVITKLSNAEIRTTHMTGVVTDIGIELGKLFYWNRQARHSGGVSGGVTGAVTGAVASKLAAATLLPPMGAVDPGQEFAPVRANRLRPFTLSLLLCSFIGGGVVGALGFQRLGYVATVPLAGLLVALALVPAWDDLQRWVRGARTPRGPR